MKILMLTQGRTMDSQRDYVQAFKSATSEGNTVELRYIPFLGYATEHGWPAFYREVVRVNDEFRPNVVFFQFFHNGGEGGIVQCCKELKHSPNKPLLFGSIGDPFDTGPFSFLERPIPKSTLLLASNADAMFSTSMGNIANELVRHGAKNVMLVPNGFGPVLFDYWERLEEEDIDSDIVMVGGLPRLISRRPLLSFRRWLNRKQTVAALYGFFGDRFVNYGGGWSVPCNRGSVAFKDQLRVFARARVAVDSPPPKMVSDYYSSDRAHYILASGTPLVMFKTPRYEKMFRPDEHAFFAHGPWDVCDACKRALALPSDIRSERRKAIRAFVRERHLIAHRADSIISMAEALVLHRQCGVSPVDARRHLRMHHFLPEVDLEEEAPYCLANWIG